MSISATYPPLRSTMRIHHFGHQGRSGPRRRLFLECTKASAEFDQLAGLFNQLPPDARKAVVEAFAAIKPNLDQLIDRVLAIPAVGAIIKPTLDAIRAKLDIGDSLVCRTRRTLVVRVTTEALHERLRTCHFVTSSMCRLCARRGI